MKKNAAAFMTLALLAGSALPVAVMAETSVDANVKVDAGDRGERREMFMQGNDERRASLEARVGDMKARIEGKGAEVRARFASSSVEARARIEANVKERVSMRSDRIYGMLTSALDRLSSFEAKVDARLDELASAGVDVSLSREALADAAQVRVAAEANIADLDAELKASLDGETSKAEIVALVRAAREELASVRTAYADVLIQVRADVKASKGD